MVPECTKASPGPSCACSRALNPGSKLAFPEQIKMTRKIKIKNAISQSGVPSLLDSYGQRTQSGASAFKPAGCGNHALVNAKKLSTACSVAFCLLLPACRQQE